MTNGWQKIPRSQFIALAEEYYSPSRVRIIRKVLRQKGLDPNLVYSGRGLFSLLLPSDLIYSKDNGKMSQDGQSVVRIHRGVMYEGVLDKSILGAAHNAISQVLFKEYSADEALQFVDRVQFLVRRWLLQKGFSIGLGDCMMNDTQDEEGIHQSAKIRGAIQRCYLEAQAVEESTRNPLIREARVSGALNKARDIGLRIAKNALVSDNAFLTTVYSGAKGDFFNIAQITGLLGQQNLLGARIKPSMSGNRRTLPHYPLDERKLSEELRYESRGFIANSFIQGLNPREFFHHHRAGREGICDTALGTATSGYIQRRIVKLTEDVQVHYDGTVRDGNMNTYQLSYGNNGIDSTHLVRTKFGSTNCDITRMVDRLNLHHEIEESSDELSDEQVDFDPEPELAQKKPPRRKTASKSRLSTSRSTKASIQKARSNARPTPRPTPIEEDEFNPHEKLEVAYQL